MSEFNETTSENLRYVRRSRGINQDEIARILGVPQSAISKIEKGNRSLSDAEKSLLDLYFFGTIPFEIANSKLLQGILDFTDDEWKVVSILATRQSVSPGKWIANQIRSYLAFNEEAKTVQSDIVRSRLQSLPRYQESQSYKCSEEPN